jgi:hypothetical protein
MAMNATVKLWRWRRNPLRRRSDVVEAWAGAALCAVLAVGAPVSGIVAANGTHEALVHQNQDRHRASATLTRNATTASAARSNGVSPDEVRGHVRWTASDGTVHTGNVIVRAGMKAGAHVPVWLDGGGRLAAPPLTGVQSAVETDVMGAGAAGGFCVLALTGHRLVRAELNRRRARQWQREWARVEPQWSGHHA